ncbi:M20/M25/M40 family metallo-hydrolase [Planctomonas deserti]|uniref:M20/M25/M40 family metallo-hydrolase n=1 Tax=Planctomonas deserti TaxID=2144185 RepID=UPI000D3510CE|nr:M20/M25/M40 family metallo-hydrolase [Planctomonas deserti]
MSSTTTPVSTDTDTDTAAYIATDAGNDSGTERLDAFLRENYDTILEQLSAWVRIPSIAAQPEHAVDVARSAHWLAGALRELGVSMELIETGDAVAVFGELKAASADAPTVLIYSHHDVRHAKPEEWVETSPFEPVLRDGRLYGRGASDAKGQIMAHLWGLRAHQLATGSEAPAVNLKFLIEGEEEMGSPHFEELLAEQPDRFACDVIVFSDTLQWKEGQPALVTSMRGMVSATLSISGPKRDVHSGAVSGLSPNPIHVLVDVLSRLHEEDGRIALPGFYDDVEEITEERAEELAALTFDDETWIERTETRSISGEEGYTSTERLWARPSLEVLSVLAGDPEGIPRAVIPSQAKAEFNIRTVPGQRVAAVAEQIRAYFAEAMPDGVDYTLEVAEESGQEPYVTPDGEELQALERAATRSHGGPVSGRMGNAGGGPAELLGRVLEAPVIFVGTGLPEDHWHASDESIEVDMLLRSAVTIAHLWSELGELPPAEDGAR